MLRFFLSLITHHLSLPHVSEVVGVVVCEIVPVGDCLVCAAKDWARADELRAQMADELNYGILDSTAAATHKLFDRNVPGRYLHALKRLKLEGKEAELRVRGEDVAKRLEGML